MDTPSLQNAEERGKRWLLTACSESSDELQVQRSMCCQPSGYVHNGSMIGPNICEVGVHQRQRWGDSWTLRAAPLSQNEAGLSGWTRA
jgi:hypothetical protein